MRSTTNEASRSIEGRSTRSTTGRTRTVLGMIAIAALMTTVSLLASCSGSEPVEISAGTIVIDVRTPQEYAVGHLDGAQLLDLNGGEFSSALPTLDPDAHYIVYCRSGNRSGQAASMMHDAGFENVTDLGTLQNASKSTGLDIVQ